MKREQATREYLGISKSDSLVAAVDAYEWVEAHPEEAEFVLRAAVFDAHINDLEEHQAEIDAVVKGFIAKRYNDIKPALARSIVSKAANGGEVDHLVAMNEALELISKADGADQFTRDRGGRFSTHEERVHTSGRVKPIKRTKARTSGIPVANDKITDPVRLAQYQQAYAQVADMLQGHRGFPEGTQVYGVTEKGAQTAPMPIKDAFKHSEDTKSATNGIMDANLFKDDALVGLVFKAPRHASDGVGYDVLGSMNVSPTSAAATQQVMNNIDAEDGKSPFNQYWNTRSKEATLGTGEAVYNKIGASAGLISSLGGEHLGPQTQSALLAAQFAAKHAPEAEKVIGPTARKNAYRYRGVEKTPDPRNQAIIDSVRRTERGRAINDKSPLNTKTPAQRAAIGDSKARSVLIHGKNEELNTRNPAAGSRDGHVESPIINDFIKKLPDPDLYKLNLASGTVPPSQGIIIDRKGKVATEAMGYGDDWYLPFNLKNLSKLQGGEYIRTRAYGGLTSEDIYAGLVSGARSVTVVSHSGVYNMEFDDDFRGTRRYSDKAARMVNRYEHLLDSLSAGKVNISSISPARQEEINNEAAMMYDPADPGDAYTNEVIRLQKRDRARPILAVADAENIKREVADKVASEDRGFTSLDSFVATEEADIQARRKAVMAPGSTRSSDEKMDALQQLHTRASALTTLDGQIGALGATNKADAAVERARQDLIMANKPLSLNGEGYRKAQEALAQQFPYYVKPPTHRKTTGEPGTDKGYIKPRFNRPAAVKAGYHDETINGSGKISADKTGYQNHATARRSTASTSTDEGRTEAATGGAQRGDTPAPTGARAAAQTQLSQMATAKAYLNIAKFIRSKQHDPIDPSAGNQTIIPAPGKAAESIAGKMPSHVIGELKDQAGNQYNGLKHYDALFSMSDSELEDAVDNPDSEGWLKVKAGVDAAFNNGTKFFVLSEDMRTSYEEIQNGTIGKVKAIERDSDGAMSDKQTREMLAKPKAKWDFGSDWNSANPAAKVAKVQSLKTRMGMNESAPLTLATIDNALDNAKAEWKEAHAASLTLGESNLSGSSVYAAHTSAVFGTPAINGNPAKGVPMIDVNGMTKKYKENIELLVKAKSAYDSKAALDALNPPAPQANAGPGFVPPPVNFTVNIDPNTGTATTGSPSPPPSSGTNAKLKPIRIKYDPNNPSHQLDENQFYRDRYRS